MAIHSLYPGYTTIFIAFNLLGWWYKGQPFISWWWFLVIFTAEMILTSLLLAVYKAAEKVQKGMK